MKNKYVQIIRLITRIAGALLILLVIAMTVAEGLPTPSQLTDKELALFAAFILMFIGLIIAYKKEILGGVLTSIGYLFFAFTEMSVNNGPIFPLFFVVGVLYIFCGWRDWVEKNKIVY